ncbi:MAG: DUF2071 domain-containing protein [Candidatus Acidiferrales bacterium]|jgi:uncharacterized protein YqjF (DUF2071 family)
MTNGDDAHRPWPAPASPWVMRQKWHDLLFMHWPVAAQDLRPLIPRALELETFDGTAWVGVVPFHMSGIRFRGLPPVPGLSAFPELNVRTYVRSGGKPGVWFFGLEAASAVAVSAARRWFHLPYFRARMSVEKAGDAIQYESHRTHRGAPEADFRATYRPTGKDSRAQQGTLEYFLTERYCLYAAAGDRIFRGEIDHPPWPLQPATAEVEINTMAASHGITLPNAKPLLHFARYQDVKIWSLARE